MELIDRYLEAVRFWLPKESKDDIIRELGENLRSQMEDKAEELGRPLTEAEQSAILKVHGEPLLAASRYWPQQQLIGPPLFLVYSFVVKLTLGLTVAGSVVAQLLKGSGSDMAAQLGVGLLSAWGNGLATFAIVTIVFAVIDRVLRSRGQWDPRSLPAVRPSRPQRTGFQMVTELVASCLGIVWWVAVPHYPFLLFGPAALFVSLTPAWGTFYVPIIVLAVISALMHYTKLLRPDLPWVQHGAEAGGKVITLVAINLMLKAGPLVMMSGADSASHAKIADLINLIVKLSLEISSVIAVLTLLWIVVKLIRSLPFMMGTKAVTL